MLKYTTINHEARELLCLDMSEYALADSIYHICNSKRNTNKGWCAAKKDYLAKWIGVSKRTVVRMINTLEEKGLIIRKSAKSNLLQTTVKWEDVVINWETYNDTSVTNLRNEGNECADLAHASVQNWRNECANLAHPIYSSNNSISINRSIDFKSKIEERVSELSEEMKSDQLHLEAICMNNRLEMQHVMNLITPWAKENASTSFQNTNHKRNSFRKFVLNAQMKVSHNSELGPVRGSKPMLKPGEIRRNVG